MGLGLISGGGRKLPFERRSSRERGDWPRRQFALRLAGSSGCQRDSAVATGPRRETQLAAMGVLSREYPGWRWTGRRARCICWRLSCSSPRQMDGSLGAPFAAGDRSLAGRHVWYVVKEAVSRLRESPSRAHRVGMEPDTPFLHAAGSYCGRQLPERAEPRLMPFHPWRCERITLAFRVWLRRRALHVWPRRTRWSPARSHAGCGHGRAPRRRQARDATRRPDLTTT